MKIFLVTSHNSEVDYSQLNIHSKDLILVFKAPTELILEQDSYDFLIVEQTAIKLDPDLHYLKKKASLDRVFLILDESKANLVDFYLSLGVKDVFVLPLNFVEFATKLKHAADLKKSALFANTKLGMSLKQILILEVLKMQGPQGATRNLILKEIWDNEKVEPKNVDVHIHNLRKVLKRQGKEIAWRQNRWYLVG